MSVEGSVRPRSAFCVVLGNEKGGSGKSTVAMHIAVALMKAGQRVATIDLNSRQKSFTHYIENRRAWAKHARLDLELPTHYCVARKRRRAGRRQRGGRVQRIRRRGRRDRAHPRFHRHRYAGPRQLSDAARAFDGRHADHAAQRQLRRFRRARHRRSGDLRGHRHQPLLRHGARCAPPAPRRRSRHHRLDRGAQPAVDARLAQQAAGRRGACRSFRCGSASAPSTASPSA